jgi:hypothetical protein
MMTTNSIPSSGPAGAAVKIVLSLFCGAAILIGSAVTHMFARGIAPGLRTHLWRESPCHIVESEVAQGADGSKSHPFVFKVLYRYELGGRAFESRIYTPGYTGSDEVSEAQRLADRYPPGSSGICYVDASAPQNACLERPGLWIALVVLLPLIFVCVGVGGIAAIWWPRRAEEEGRKAISERPKLPRVAAGCVVGFFSLFVLAGLVTSLLFVRQALASFAVRSWPEVPCVVLSSEVRRHTSTEHRGLTFSVDVLYEYKVGGRTHRSNRYQFLGGSSSGYDSKAAVVAQNPPGRRRTCFVNPADPNDAVLTRSFGAEHWFLLIPLVFAAVGIAGIVFMLRSRRRTG